MNFLPKTPLKNQYKKDRIYFSYGGRQKFPKIENLSEKEQPIVSQFRPELPPLENFTKSCHQAAPGALSRHLKSPLCHCHFTH